MIKIMSHFSGKICEILKCNSLLLNSSGMHVNDLRKKC